MKLVDFINDKELNELRRKMRAEIHPYSSPPPRTTITPEEVEALATKGIDIPLTDVGVLNDGTFTYKGRRVVVYIRDVASYRDDYSLPKFHLAMCDTLLTMKSEGRYEKRYVVATREDGFFRIQIIKNNNVISSTDEGLIVCQNCLHGLHYKGFDRHDSRRKKEKALKEFSLGNFFEEFDRSPVWASPDYDAIHAPTNVYSPDFYTKAKLIKQHRGYICEDPRCKRNLSKPEHQRFLHAHHLNGDKTDNRPSNIKLLCIHCHAKAFNHTHIRDYERLQRILHAFWFALEGAPTDFYDTSPRPLATTACNTASSWRRRRRDTPTISHRHATSA